MRALGGSGSMSRIPVYFASLAQRYGGIAHWKLGAHFYFVDDPAYIEEAFVFRERDYMRGRGIQRLKRILGDGLLSSEEPLHLRQRRLMAPAFHRDRIDGYGHQMVAAGGPATCSTSTPRWHR
jgi:cytochrome P450